MTKTPVPSKAAVSELAKSPDLDSQSQFDQVFGKGSAQRILRARVSQAAINELRKSPDANSVSQFDETFGEGMSKSVLSGVDTRKHYKLSEVPGAAINHLVPSFQNLAGGMVEMGRGALKGAVHAVADPADTASYLFNAKDHRMVNDVSKFAKGTAKFYGQRYGGRNLAEVYDNVKRTIAEDPAGFIGDVSGAATGGAGIVGKVVGPASKAARIAAKVGEVGEAINPARVVAPAVELPVKLAGKGVKFVHNAMDPKATTYLTAAEGKGKQIVNALRDPSIEIVPGSKPTAAQAAADVGATRFSAMGATSAKKLSSEYFERAEQQKAAQIAQIDKVAKTPTDMKAAEALRDTHKKANYNASGRKTAQADDALVKLMKRPSMSKVIHRADELMAERDSRFQIGKTAPARTDLSAVPSETIDVLQGAGHSEAEIVKYIKQSGMGELKDIPATFAKYPGNSLHAMKMAFDDLIKDPDRFGIGASEVAAIKGTRAEFVNWLENKIPEYKVARETFAKDSGPINRMEVGQQLRKDLVPALGEDSSATLRADKFANSIENAPKTIKKATGQSRFETLEEVLTPDELDKVYAIRDDLARAKLNERQARAAGALGPDVGKAGSDVMAAARIPSFLNRATTLANEIIKRLQGQVDEKMAIEMAKEMLDPSSAADALEKAIIRDAKFNKNMATAAKVGKVGSKILRNPVIYNSLSPRAQNNNALIQ